jgi:hypothetical protein
MHEPLLDSVPNDISRLLKHKGEKAKGVRVAKHCDLLVVIFKGDLMQRRSRTRTKNKLVLQPKRRKY